MSEVECFRVRQARREDLPGLFLLRSMAYERTVDAFNHRDLRKDDPSTLVFMVEDHRGASQILPYQGPIAAVNLKIARNIVDLDAKLEVCKTELINKGIGNPFKRVHGVVLVASRLVVHPTARRLGISRMLRAFMHEVFQNIPEADALMGLTADDGSNPIPALLRRIPQYRLWPIQTNRAIFPGQQVVYRLSRPNLQNANHRLRELQGNSPFPSYEWAGERRSISWRNTQFDGQAVDSLW